MVWADRLVRAFHDVAWPRAAAWIAADRALAGGFDPQPRSGRQEYLESLVNPYV
jgi:xylose isomerase